MWKWAPNGNPHVNNFKVQGEYFWRKEHGDLVYDADGALGRTSTSGYDARQRGWYLQGVYQFMPLWRVGARYDRLDAGSVDYGANVAFLPGTSFSPQRSTVMVDWSPSEFSRVRLQYAARASCRASPTTSGSCNTSSASAPTARTSTRSLR